MPTPSKGTVDPHAGQWVVRVLERTGYRATASKSKARLPGSMMCSIILNSAGFFKHSAVCPAAWSRLSRSTREGAWEHDVWHYFGFWRILDQFCAICWACLWLVGIHIPRWHDSRPASTQQLVGIQNGRIRKCFARLIYL